MPKSNFNNKDKPRVQSTDAHKIPKNKKVKTKRFVLTKYKLSASIGGHIAGDVINIECRIVGGAPKDRYWRRRLRDAEIDGCMTKVPKVKKEKPVELENAGNDSN